MNNYFKLVAILALTINLSHLLLARSISFDDNMLEGMIESSIEKMLKNDTKSNETAQQTEQHKEQSKYISYELNEDLKTLLKDELQLLEKIQEQIKVKNISESEVAQLMESLKVHQRTARKAIFEPAVDAAVLYHIYDVTTDNTLGFRKKRQAYGYGSDYSYSQPLNNFVQQPQFDQQAYAATYMDNSYGAQQVAPSFDQSSAYQYIQPQPQVQQTMDYQYMQPQPQLQQTMDYGFGQAVQQDLTQYQPAQYQYQEQVQPQPAFEQPITVQIETQQYIQPVYPSADNTAATYVQSINTQSYNDDVDISTLLKNQPIIAQPSSYAPAVQSVQPAPVQQTIYGASASNYGPAPEQDIQVAYETVEQPTFAVQQDLSYGVQQDQDSYGVQQDLSSYGNVQQDQSQMSYGNQPQIVQSQQEDTTYEYQEESEQPSQPTYGGQPAVQQASFAVQAPAPVVQQQQPSYAAHQPAPVVQQQQPSYAVQKPAPVPVVQQQPSYAVQQPVRVQVQFKAPVRQHTTYVNTIQQDQTLLRDEKIPSSVCPTGFAEPIYEGEEVGETYCRCLDGSYGFSCNEGFLNPCNGDSQFYPADSSLPRKYFIHCSWDMPYLKKCSGDLVWNNLLQTCDWNAEPAVVQQSQSIVSFTAPKTVYGY